MDKHYGRLQRQGRLLRSRIAEGMVFLRRFVGAPRQVGSIVPSSPYLTRAVLDGITDAGLYGDDSQVVVLRPRKR